MEELLKASKATNAWACYNCGKCTATCPIARAGDEYSPRRHVLSTNLGKLAEVAADGSLGHCLTCSLCDERCPVEVKYSDLVQKLRGITRVEGETPECPHGGALQSMMRIMARGGTTQNRMSWLSDDLKTEPAKGEAFYWTGCAMYYDAFFPESEGAALNGTRSAVKLMNQVGDKPVISPEERCCGHDLLWNGDRNSFEALARHNVEVVKRSGAKYLVTSCAECLRTWKLDYAPYMNGHSVEMLHISQYLMKKRDQLKFRTNGTRQVVYQDPCRLGRQLGIYDPPREVLTSVPGVELREMRRSKKGSLCCAGGTWSNCDRYAKKIQVDRLREAKGTGAEVLATACPKCQIHFRCAMKDPNLAADIEIEMKDVAELVLESLAVEGVATKSGGMAKVLKKGRKMHESQQ